MKLYATVTSERATKGQGGEWLDINLKDERECTFAIIKVRKDSGYFMPTLEIETIGAVIKGKKQKDIACPVCDKPFKNGTCEDCDKLVNSL